MLNTITKFFPVLMRDITTLGGSVFYLLAVLLALIFNQQELFLDFLLGFLISLAIIVIIRVLYFKHRPQKQHYSNFIEKLDASSFPSWHTARAVFMAVVFSLFFSNTAITLLLAVLALSVAYSRIYLKKHDWIDVIGGVLLGAVTFWIIIVLR